MAYLTSPSRFGVPVPNPFHSPGAGWFVVLAAPLVRFLSLIPTLRYRDKPILVAQSPAKIVNKGLRCFMKVIISGFFASALCKFAIRDPRPWSPNLCAKLLVVARTWSVGNSRYMINGRIN